MPKPLRIFSYILLGIIGLLLLVIVLIQIPAIQTFATKQIVQTFEKQWGTRVEIGKVNLTFFETALIEDIYVEDQNGDTLLFANKLKADIGLFALFGKEIILDEIALENAFINLYRNADSTRFNYEFIAETFTSADTTQPADTTSGGFDFDLKQVRLEQVRFNYIDDSAKMELRVKAPYLLTDFETLGLKEEHLKIDNVAIKDFNVLFRQITPAPDNAVTKATETADSVVTKVAEVDPAPPSDPDSAWLNPTGFRYTINSFEIENSRVHFQTSLQEKEGEINFENLDFTNLNLLLGNTYAGSDTVTTELERLSFLEDNSGFLLQNLAFNFTIEGTEVTAALQEFITANSRITDEIKIEKLDINAGDEMLAQLKARTKVEDAVISMKDAAFFTEALDTLPNLRDQDIRLSMNLKVEENKASVDKLIMHAGDGLYLNARAYAQNLNQPEKLTFDVQLQELTTSMTYIEALSLVDSLPPGSRQAGNLTLVAQAEGSLDNVTLSARLKSGVGNLQANVLYKAPTESSFMVAGRIDANDFDLTPFAGDSSGLGTITLTSNIRAGGSGDAIDVNKFSLLVKELEFNQYTYENLAVEGHFIDSVLEVATAYQDPFLDFDFLLKSDLKDSLPLLTAEGNIDEVNFLRLNLMQDSIILSTRLTAEIKGQTPDNIRGFLKLRNTELIRGAKSFTMDSLIVASNSLPENRREIIMETDFMSASLTGKYLFEELPLAIDQCASYYCSAYKIDTTSVASRQEIELDFLLRDEPVILKAFMPTLELTHPMTVHASMENELRSFNLDVKAPGIMFDSILIKDFVIDAKTVNKVLSFDIEADKIVVGETVDIPQFGLEGSWEQDSVHFDLALAPPTDSTHLLLGGSFTFLTDTITLELDNTGLAIKGKDYMLADNSIIKYTTDYLSINDFTLQRENQRLSIYTQQEGTPKPEIITEIENFEVAEFMQLAGLEDYGLAATFNGNVKLTDAANLSAIEAGLAINDIIIDSIRAGDITIQADKVSDNGRINTEINLTGPGNDLDINGYYNIEDSTDAMSLIIDMERLKLSPWQPFVADFISEMRGSLQGRMEISGTVPDPVVEGFLNFGEQTAFRPVATGALYNMEEQRITIDSEIIRFNSLTLTDPQNNKLVVDGTIGHENFGDFLLDFTINSENFQVVNKERTPDDPVYGTLSIQTVLEVSGPVEDVQVEGRLKINEDTDLVMVLLEDEKTIGDIDYINFVNTNAFIKKDTTTALPDTLEQAVDISGFSLSALLTITPESQFTIIVDPATGDYLEVSGESELRINMNPLEGLNLQGTYTVTDGRYRLSFMEVIQKNFDLQKGSTVEFSGDPMDASLNMTAVYTTETSRYPLVEAQAEFLSSAELSAAKQRKPVDVLLSLVGTLENPEFTFNIIVPESDYNMNSAVSQQLAEIKEDQSKLFKQVFGLIVMNRFIPETPGMGGGGGGAEQAINSRIDQSLSSFLTDQLSAVTQDYLGVSLEVDIDTRQNMQGEDAGFAEKDVGLQLGRSLFNERVEVKVGGTSSIGNSEGTAVGGGDAGTQFAGNFEILYHINERGNLNLKIFQRNQRNLMTNEFIPQPGVALSYSKSFDQWGEFIGQPRTRQEILKSDGAIVSDPEEGGK